VLQEEQRTAEGVVLLHMQVEGLHVKMEAEAVDGWYSTEYVQVAGVVEVGYWEQADIEHARMFDGVAAQSGQRSEMAAAQAVVV
jgi:hypothetical protein